MARVKKKSGKKWLANIFPFGIKKSKPEQLTAMNAAAAERMKTITFVLLIASPWKKGL